MPISSNGTMPEDRGTPRTLVPTAVQFHEGFDQIQYQNMAQAGNTDLIPRPLSLYIHLPFCQSLCYFCACNKKVTRHRHHGVQYMQALQKEIELQGRLFDDDRLVEQLHLGGGTPTYFTDTQISELMRVLSENFHFPDAGSEFSVELDPRTMNRDRLTQLAGLGFNRFSMGIQDFDPEVQQAVNRNQSREDTLELIECAQSMGASSVSVDLIYGLPHQTPKRFARTLDAVLSARPDRVSIYNYAHLPQTFRAQRLIREEDIPALQIKLELLRLSIEKLTEAGYRYIGMDHFALPDDELATAQDNGSLQRNFQGYSTHKECDLVGLGVSAIGRVRDCYAQNHKDISRWSENLETGDFAIWRGIVLSAEDRLRRRIIEAIMCYGSLDFLRIEQRFNIDFQDFFALEINRLEDLAADGLITLDESSLELTPAGQILMRHVAMVFDSYHTPAEAGENGTSSYSRII